MSYHIIMSSKSDYYMLLTLLLVKNIFLYTNGDKQLHKNIIERGQCYV